MDRYVMDSVRSHGIEPTRVVLERIENAMNEQQKRREIVFDYALKRASGIATEKPYFWEATEKAIVDESLRNHTKWYDIVKKMEPELVI